MNLIMSIFSMMLLSKKTAKKFTIIVIANRLLQIFKFKIQRGKWNKWYHKWERENESEVEGNNI